MVREEGVGSIIGRLSIHGGKFYIKYSVVSMEILAWKLHSLTEKKFHQNTKKGGTGD